MIVVTKDGRHRSHRTKKEKRENFIKQMKSLSVEDKILFSRIMEDFNGVTEAGESGFDSRSEIVELSSFYSALSDDHYVGAMADLDTFLEDDYFLGEVGRELYPKWKEDLHELYRGQYTEAVISGSIGSGKTTYCELGLLRDFYELTMLRDPQSTFGLMAGSEILLVCFNRDDNLARKVTYGGVKAKLERSPYFNEIGCKVGTSEAILPDKNISIVAVSARSSKALGRNVFGGIIDETDFLEGSSISGKERAISPGDIPFAEQLHGSIIRRMKSRYERQGFLPGRLYMSSSAKNKESFTNRRIGEAANEAGIFCRDYAIYDVKPAHYYPKERFWVLVGNERIMHRILTDKEYEALGEIGVADFERQGCRFINPPVNFKKDFERNLEDSIRDISGVVTAPKSVYIQLRDKIHECIDPGLKHPLRDEVWVTGSAPSMIWSRVAHDVEHRKGKLGRIERAIEPIRHPEAPRHVHVDLALGKQDAAGICIAHIVDMLDVERRSEDGHMFAEAAPLIEVDLFLRIEAPPNGEVDIGAIRGLVYHYMERGFAFNFASMDSWQSAESLQKYRQQGIVAEKISVDSKMEPYDYLKLAIYEGRLSFYNYPIVLKELEQLEKDNMKHQVIHPSNGSKDCADSLAGVVYSLSTRTAYAVPVLMGMSEYEGDESNDEWIRQTMNKSGDKAPEPVGKSPRGGGPLVFSG